MELATNSSNKTNLGNLGATEKIVEVLDVHGSDFPGVAEFSFRAMMNLAVEHIGNKTKLGACGACEKITHWMKTFGEYCPSVVPFACGAIMNLANGCVPNKARLGDCGACEVIANIIFAFVENSNVIQTACGVIKNLGSHPPNRARFAEVGELKRVLTNISKDTRLSKAHKHSVTEALKVLG